MIPIAISWCRCKRLIRLSNNYTESVCDVPDGFSAGAIRSTKGKVVEDIAEAAARIAWQSVGGTARARQISKREVSNPYS